MSRAFQTAVVIPTTGRERLLRRTLESVAEAAGGGCLAEVRVVENGGDGSARSVVDGLTHRLPTRYMVRREGNKASALNAALEECVAEFVCFLDDDVRVEAGTLRAYIDAAERYGRRHHFAGPLLPDWEEEPPRWLKPHLPHSVTGWYHGEEERYYDRPHFIGSNWAAFRQDILEGGGFLPGIGPGSPTDTVGDEMELQHRLLEAGNRGVYLPRAVARHFVSKRQCDFEWARDRQRRTGRTYGVLGWPLPGGADRCDGWRAGVLAGKVAVARTLRWTLERRAYLEMTLARTRGYREGRRMRDRTTDSASFSFPEGLPRRRAFAPAPRRPKG